MSTAPFLIPCLVVLRTEFNVINPTRDKGADGWIGDLAHQAETSDHNPDSMGRVLAIDIDCTGPWDGESFDRMTLRLVERCRTGEEDRVEYIIWNGFIYSRSYEFAKRTYTGTDKHTNHAHISGRHDHHGENDTRPWNITGGIEDMTDAEMQKFAGYVAAAIWNADVIPYTGTDGTKDTWRAATAVGYMTQKSRDAVTVLNAIEEKN